MPYIELEQFLDRGAIRAWWGLSWRTFFGCAAGAVIGQQLGQAVYGPGTAGMAVLAVVGAAVGLVVLMKRRGIVVAQRAFVLGTFALRVLARRATLDGAQLGGRIHDDAPTPIQVRVGSVSVPAADRVDGDERSVVAPDGAPAELPAHDDGPRYDGAPTREVTP